MTAVPQELKGASLHKAYQVLPLGTSRHCGACQGSKWERKWVPLPKEVAPQNIVEYFVQFVTEEEEEKSHMSSCDNLISTCTLPSCY